MQSSRYFAILTLTTYEEYEAEVFTQTFLPQTLLTTFPFEISDGRDNFFITLFIKHQFQVQSNVEDVAVMLRQMAEANGWETVMDPSMGTFVEELQAQLKDPKKYPSGKRETSTIYKKKHQSLKI